MHSTSIFPGFKLSLFAFINSTTASRQCSRPNTASCDSDVTEKQNCSKQQQNHALWHSITKGPWDKDAISQCYSLDIALYAGMEPM